MNEDTKRLAALADETPLREGLACMGLAGAAEEIDKLRAENAALWEALGGTSETGRGYTLKKIREDLESCGFSGKDAELVITYLLSSGLIQIGKDMMARAALARQTEGEG